MTRYTRTDDLYDRSRSRDIVDHETLRHIDVAIIGAGAIGSNAALSLAKLGVGVIFVYDDDTVAPENMEPQMYLPPQVSMNKADALVEIVKRFVPDVQIFANRSKVTGQLAIRSKLVIGGVDSIESRRMIAQSLKLGTSRWAAYIDARMGGNIIEAYLVVPESLPEYNVLLDRERPLELPCSARATSYNGAMIASVVSRYVAAISKGQPVPTHIHFDMLGWRWNQSKNMYTVQLADDDLPF